LPTFFSIMALSGFIVVVTAGVAEAVGVHGGCHATLNGKDPAELDMDHALVVKKGGYVRFVGVVPASVQNVPHDQLTSKTHIDVDIVAGIGGVTSSDHSGHGVIWGGEQSVDKYLKYGVGLYHVAGRATGGPGGWSCDGDGYVKLKDGNPLGKPIGEAAAGLAVAGAVGAGLSTRGGDPADSSDGDSGGSSDGEPEYGTAEWLDKLHKEESDALDRNEADREQAEEAARNRNPFVHMQGDLDKRGALRMDTSGDAATSLGCLALLVVATAMASLGKGIDAGVVAAAATGNRNPRRVWAHGHPIVGFVSGLFLGIGVTVLLQQFAAWPLTIVTAIAFPVVTAVICSLRAWLGRPYRFV